MRSLYFKIDLFLKINFIIKKTKRIIIEFCLLNAAIIKPKKKNLFFFLRKPIAIISNDIIKVKSIIIVGTAR